MQARRFSEQDVALVRDRADLPQLVEAHGVTLRRAGTSWKGLCPFHDERTPSFSVRPETGTFHCFGCGASGDAIEFVMSTMFLPFPEAVRHLASTFGVTLSEQVDPDTQHREQQERASRAALEAAARFFQEQLHTPTASHAQTELGSRHLTAQHARDFGCGYAPRGRALVEALHRAGVRDETAVAAGLLGRDGERTYPFFTDRLMFPITDRRGRLAGFGGRRLRPDQKQKYLNSPEGLVFKKRELLYGLHQARSGISRAGRVLIVEGYTDVMACHAAEVTEAVATCGTAFGEHHLRQLTQGTAPGTRVVFCFDGDTAGIAAARRAWAMSRSIANRLYVIELPDAQDPCDVFKQHGGPALKDAVGQEAPMTQWLLEKIAASAEPTPEGRSRALHSMGEMISQLPDPVLREEYSAYVQQRWGSRPAARPSSPAPSRQPQPPAAGWEQLQRRICRRLISNPQEVWVALTNEHAPPLEDAAAQVVLEAARAIAASGIDPLSETVKPWAGAVLAAVKEQDADAAAAVLSVWDDEETVTSDLLEDYWIHGEARARQQQVDQLVAEMAEATTPERQEQLWARYEQLLAHPSPPQPAD